METVKKDSCRERLAGDNPSRDACDVGEHGDPLPQRQQFPGFGAGVERGLHFSAPCNTVRNALSFVSCWKLSYCKMVCIFRPLVMPYKAMPTGMAGNQSNVETGATASRNTHCSCTALIISCLGIVYDFFGLFFQVGKNVVFLYVAVS